MSYKTVDLMIDGVHALTMSGTEEQIEKFVSQYDGDVDIVEWVDGIDPKITVNKNQNLEDIDLMIATDKDENSFYDIAKFVDAVRKENPDLRDDEITLTFDPSQSDHEVVTLVAPRKGAKV